MRASRLVLPLVLLFNAGIAGVFAPAPSVAAEAAAQAEQPPRAQASPPAATASDSGGLEEVLVTARFKSESLQTAPIAITAVTGEQLDARGYVDITQVANIAPNVNLEQAGSGSASSPSSRSAASGSPTSNTPSSPAWLSISTMCISVPPSAPSST